jgi:cytochrome P450
MMVHSAETRGMSAMEFVGNLTLLIVGGNDTTRNSMSGGLLALSWNPDQLTKLKANPGLVPSLVAETIRYQTPVIHMRRAASRDTELAGQHIRRGDKVVMWYVSGNRDESVIDRADHFIIDRAKPRQHLSYGAGIHRCVATDWRTCSSGYSGKKFSPETSISRWWDHRGASTPTSSAASGSCQSGSMHEA